jgi:hypothetical protein
LLHLPFLFANREDLLYFQTIYHPNNVKYLIEFDIFNEIIELKGRLLANYLPRGFLIRYMNCIQNCIHGDKQLVEKSEVSETRSWARRMLGDPITKLLAEHSNLTQVQLETLLIDYLADGFGGKQLDYQTKATLRENRLTYQRHKGVSRGAFNRSLAQARKNVTKSIFTLVLLGYLGLFETPSLKRYQDISDNIRSYAREYDQVATTKEKPTHTHINTLKQAQDRILKLIEALAQPLALKPK